MPGTYSLTAHSIDELIARDYIVEEKYEFRAPKWVLFAPIYTLTLAFLVSTLVIVIGHLIGLS